jgi:hypothetical protein
MATALKMRGGTTAEHSTFTGLDREVTVDTDKYTVVVHDGSTAGGFPAVVPTEAHTFSASQRGTVTTDNDGSFDLDVTNNFSCTPTADFTLTFTNITAGQSGFILLANPSGYTVSLHANTKGDANLATTLTTAGTYLMSYFSDGTDVYVTTSGAFA